MSESLGEAVLILKTDNRQFKSGLTEAKGETVSLRQSFEKVKGDLLGLGKDGKVSMDSLGTAFRNPTQGAKGLAMEVGGSLVGGMGAGTLAAVALTGAVVAAGAAVTKMAFDAAAAGGALDDASEITGISVERLSGLKFAAEVTGGSLDQLTGWIFKMQQQMLQQPDDFERGLKAIGLTAKDLEDLTLDEKFLKINEAFREVGPGAKQAEAAIALFTRQGRDAIPLLNEDIKGLVDRSKELGMTWSTEDASAAEDLERKSAELHAVWENLWVGIGNFFIPALHGVVTVATDAAATIHNLWENVRLLWGEVRNMPELPKTPKTNIGAAGQTAAGDDPLAFLQEIAKKEDEVYKKRAVAAAEEKKRTDELNKIRQKAIDDEMKRQSDLNTHLAKLSDQRAKADMDAIADEYQRAVKAEEDLVRLDREAKDKMLGELYRQQQEEADAQKKANEEKVRVFKDTFDTITTAVQGSFAQMMLGTKSFKEGWSDIWQSIKAGTLQILNDILNHFLKQFLGGMLNALMGQQGAFQGALGGLFGMGGGGLPGAPGGGGGGLGGILGGIFGKGGAAGKPGGAGLPGGLGGGLGGILRFGGGGLLAAGGLLQLFKSDTKTGSTLGGLQAGAGIGTMIMPGIGTAIGAGVGALAGFVKGLFGGPSKEEKEGRGVSKAWAATVSQMLTDQQRIEAGGESWKEQIVLVRDAYLKIGKTEQEALDDVKAVWDAEKKGGGAVEAQVLKIVESLQKAEEQAAQTGETTEESFDVAAQKLLEGGRLWDEFAEKGGIVGPEIRDSIRAALAVLPNDARQVAIKIENILDNITVDPVKIRTTFYNPDIPRGEPDVPEFTTGTMGNFLDFGPKGTLVKLHNRERVVTEAEGRAGDAGTAQVVAVLEAIRDGQLSIEDAILSQRATSVQIDGREVARSYHRTLDQGGAILTEAQELMVAR